MTRPVGELRYPLGRFRYPGSAGVGWRRQRLDEIRALPESLREAVRGLTEPQWDTPYRPGGWTVRQVVHHLPDSHMNAYTRFKLALTEDRPTIRPYDEAAWAELADSRDVPPEVSLALLEWLHARWAGLLESMDAADYERMVWHPEQNRTMSLNEMLGLYAWHGRHHLAHITSLAEREGW